jgi:tRNA(Ile)-lysidine synthase TilS/MesJ
MTAIYDLFVSGGKDSVVAATIAYEEARRLGIPVTLHEYVEKKLKQPRLTQYLETGGMDGEHRKV